jgi:hypothetical protein
VSLSWKVLNSVKVLEEVTAWSVVVMDDENMVEIVTAAIRCDLRLRGHPQDVGRCIPSHEIQENPHGPRLDRWVIDESDLLGRSLTRR